MSHPNMLVSRAARFLVAGLAATVLMTGIGCVSLANYTPNAAVVDQLGDDTARSRFAEVLTRSTTPRYNTAEITDDYFRCEMQQVIMGAFYTSSVVNTAKTVHFANITGVEVYENNVVYVRGPQGEIALHATFTTQEDAFLLADILNAFIARKRAAG